MFEYTIFNRGKTMDKRLVTSYEELNLELNANFNPTNIPKGRIEFTTTYGDTLLIKPARDYYKIPEKEQHVTMVFKLNLWKGGAHE